MELRDKAFYALEVLNSDQRLMYKFLGDFPKNTIAQVWDALKWGLLSEENQQLLTQIVPPVYKIGGRLFLHGEERGEHDFVGDALHYQKAIELYDMTTEMKTGDSYTFYVSTVGYFEVACAKDATDVKIFLDSLK